MVWDEYIINSRAIECKNGAKTECGRAKKPCEEGEAIMRDSRGSGG
jgi:hypothetical protein